MPSVLRAAAWLLGCLALAACEINQYEARSVAGNYVRESNWQLGGARSAARSDGSSYANGYENSFRDGAAAVGIGIGAVQTVKVNSSNNALTGLQNTNAAGVTKAGIAADTAVQLGAQKAGLVPIPK